LLPPLVIGEAEIAECVETLSEAARVYVGPADD
jgi:acetylornithine/N-succinyldiaminopimelate aminotransferase